MVEQKKKILFSAYSLNVGGIETALVNLIKFLHKTNKYEITLVLERKEGVLLNQLPQDITIIEYSPCYNKIYAKFVNAIKRLVFSFKYKNKFDATFAYTTYCRMAAATANIASENANLWVHSNYLDIFNNNEDEYIKFFKKLGVDNFNNIIFVSNESKTDFERIMKKNNTILCNNIIDYEKIIELSKERIVEYKEDTFTFLYIGRIVETSKKISRLLEAAKILKAKKLKYKIIIIGNGEDLDKCKKKVKEWELEEYVHFLGEKINPYPYFKIADSLILVSENEGYPVVFNEAKILELPILTTNVSDAKLEIDKKYGIVCNNDVLSISNSMEELIQKGFKKIVRKYGQV